MWFNNNILSINKMKMWSEYLEKSKTLITVKTQHHTEVIQVTYQFRYFCFLAHFFHQVLWQLKEREEKE